MADPTRRFHEQWLGMVQPVEGLVFSIPVLEDAQGAATRHPPQRQHQLLELCTEQVADDGLCTRRLRDLEPLLCDLLGYEPDLFDRGDALPDDLAFWSYEGKQKITPTMVLRRQSPATTGEAGADPGSDEPVVGDDSTPQSRAGAPYIMMIWQLPDGLPLDDAETTTGPWPYPPAAKFDRLLRACRIPIGLLCNGDVIRLVYAPHGEATGSMNFPISVLTDVGGRPVLDAFLNLLSVHRLFGMRPEHCLPALLAESRKRQANVTNELADQLFEALGILLTGFESAAELDGWDVLSRALRDGQDDADASDELYSGLLTVLLRLVFVLYAEDRDLLPTGNTTYARGYSVLGLFNELQEDHGTTPDTMSRRFGAWPRLVALFRCIFLGAEHGDFHMPARRGNLFDPQRFPFLEGRVPGAGAPIGDAEARAQTNVPSIDDGTVYQVLSKLILLDGQRLSYRTLDVEQIGSVYEALMGYHVQKLTSDAVCVRPARVWVTADELLAVPAAGRQKWLVANGTVTKAHAKKIAAELKAAPDAAAVLAALEPVACKVRGTRGALSARAGALVLQPGKERRRTSSHYTPRSLTEPIVRRTIEPLLATLGQDPSSDQLLELKICDPAMGSGAFLVEACRYLADQVVAAWTREGRLTEISAETEDVVMRARRLVAQKCLYGVDKNHFAVSLAKLSLWLVTLARDEPFTFVDHALRHGDSLVGLSLDQLRGFSWQPAAQLALVEPELRTAIEEALVCRKQILALAGETHAGVTKEKEHLLWDAEDAIERARLLGDIVVGAWFAHKKDKDRKAELQRRLDVVAGWLGTGDPVPQELLEWRREILEHLPVFHWMLEFPEIFYDDRPDPLEDDHVNQAAWMDAFLGNPPFGGKNLIADSGGFEYIPWLQQIHDGAHGNADLSAHFFLRAESLLGAHGTMGLIATNTIAQGDTRATGLQILVTRKQCTIYDAHKSRLWPGEAAVAFSVVHLAKGSVAGADLAPRLDGMLAAAINSRLLPKPERPDPVTLVANSGKSYQGSIVLGMGFTLTPEERDALVKKDKRNAERIFPYLGGKEVNTSPTQTFDRYVINFGEMTLGEAGRWPDLLAIVRDKVKPERDKLKNTADGKRLKASWWLFCRARPELYGQLAERERCLVTARVTKHLCFSFQPTDRVLNEKLYVCLFEDHAHYGVLQSRIHNDWTWLLSSTLEERLNYSATDCFATFPFPADATLGADGPLEAIGRTLYDVRAQLMVARNQGLTTTYNQLKDPDNPADDADIAQLRQLHLDLDRAVLAAYGWQDIPIPPYCSPQTPTEKQSRQTYTDEIIDRLFTLNATRAQEERAQGLGKKTKKKPKKPRKKKPSTQKDLFDK